MDGFSINFGYIGELILNVMYFGIIISALFTDMRDIYQTWFIITTGTAFYYGWALMFIPSNVNDAFIEWFITYTAIFFVTWIIKYAIKKVLIKYGYMKSDEEKEKEKRKNRSFQRKLNNKFNSKYKY